MLLQHREMLFGEGPPLQQTNGAAATAGVRKRNVYDALCLLWYLRLKNGRDLLSNNHFYKCPANDQSRTGLSFGDDIYLCYWLEFRNS